MKPGVSGHRPSTMRPFGFVPGGASKRPRHTFDTPTRRMIETVMGEPITPVITRGNLQSYIWRLQEIIEELWDATGGRLSAKEQQHVRTTKRVIEWLQRVSEDFP